jgi:hypothetical protein
MSATAQTVALERINHLALAVGDLEKAAAEREQ